MEIKFIKIVLVLLIFITACSDEKIIVPVTDTGPGILRTDELGNSLGGDTTDWCYQGHCADTLFVCNKFFPVYPNPVISNFNIRFDVQKDSSKVRLYFLYSQKDTNFLINEYRLAGSYLLMTNKQAFNLTSGYKRLYIEIEDFSCFGDVEF